MEPAVIIMMLSVFFLLLSITVGLYSLFCGLSAAGDVRRMRNSTALRTGESDDKDKKVPTPVPRLAEAGIEVNGKTWILLLVLLAGAGALIGFMALGLIGIGFALIGPLIAELWVRSRGKSRKARFDEQLARSLPMVAENMRAGSSIERALRSVGENSDDPLKSELLACAGAMQIDGDIVAALDDMAKRTGSKDLVLLQAAVASHKEVGGSLADSLERIGDTIDARLSLRRHIESETSSVIASMKALIVMLLILFASWIPILPVSGMTTIGAGYTGFAYVLDVAHHLILPVVTLAILYIAQYSRMERASMIDILGTDYIRTARAKGLRERTVVYKHALKNALIPVVTLAGMQFSQVFAGAVLVETVFNWPGMGRLAYESILRKDYPTLLGILFCSVFVVIIANVLTDFAYRFLDPKMRVGRR